MIKFKNNSAAFQTKSRNLQNSRKVNQEGNSLHVLPKFGSKSMKNIEICRCLKLNTSTVRQMTICSNFWMPRDRAISRFQFLFSKEKKRNSNGHDESIPKLALRGSTSISSGRGFLVGCYMDRVKLTMEWNISISGKGL